MSVNGPGWRAASRRARRCRAVPHQRHAQARPVGPGARAHPRSARHRRSVLGIGGIDDSRVADARARQAASRRAATARDPPVPRGSPLPWRLRRPQPSPSTRRCPTALPRTAARSSATIASNTGCVSVAELLITRRISAVAVCCSSASCVSLNSRVFSIGDHAPGRRTVCSSAISLSRRIRPAACERASGADRFPSRSSGTASDARTPAAGRTHRVRSGSVDCVPVRNVDRALRTRWPATGRCSRGRWARPRCKAFALPSRVACAPARTISRPRERTRPRSQSSRPSQLSRIASNTGCVSVGELLMTAGCRPSPSGARALRCVSLNSRTFSIAMTAWSTKDCASAISASVKAPRLLRMQRQHADALVVAHERQHRATTVRRAARGCAARAAAASIAVQSGRCSSFLPTITLATGSSAAGSTGTLAAIGSIAEPSDVAPATGEKVFRHEHQRPRESHARSRTARIARSRRRPAARRSASC